MELLIIFLKTCVVGAVALLVFHAFGYCFMWGAMSYLKDSGGLDIKVNGPLKVKVEKEE